ncbi:MAG: hypothetical protein LUH15_16015 [Tannerellaceae bacterium]|nr:hypothetical protein [Tannerellaceae bacterium]
MTNDNELVREENGIQDNQLICTLTGKSKKITDKELTLQSLIIMLNEEYNFELEDMERDFSIPYKEEDMGKKKRLKVDLAVFEPGKEHSKDYLIRIGIVQDSKVKKSDLKRGVEGALELPF